MYPVFKQIFLSFGIWCQQINTGFIFGMLLVIVLRLRDPNSPIKLTTDQESWIAASGYLTLCPSNITSGLLTSRFGRKYTYILYLLPSFGAVAFFYYANNFSTLLVAFLLSALSGGAGPIGMLSIAECSSPKNRGTLIDIKMMSLFLGTALAHLLSIFIGWRTLVLWNIVTIIIPFITCLISPESPAWLASKGRFDECKASFNWYRGETENEELERLIDWQQHVLTEKKLKAKNGVNRLLHVCRDKVFLKSAFITAMALLVFDFSGKLMIQTYVDIINAITRDPNNAQRNIFILDISDVIAMCCSAAAASKMKRRTIMFGLGIPSVVCLYIFCGATYLFSLNLLPNDLLWLPFVMIVLYFFFINLSVLPTINMLQAEIFPLEHRGSGIVFQSIVFAVSTFTIAKVTPTFLMLLGVHGLFMISALVLTLSMIFFYYTIPETFNKTLQTIECDLMTRNCEKSPSDMEAASEIGT